MKAVFTRNQQKATDKLPEALFDLHFLKTKNERPYSLLLQIKKAGLSPGSMATVDLEKITIGLDKWEDHWWLAPPKLLFIVKSTKLKVKQITNLGNGGSLPRRIAITSLFFPRTGLYTVKDGIIHISQDDGVVVIRTGPNTKIIERTI